MCGKISFLQIMTCHGIRNLTALVLIIQTVIGLYVKQVFIPGFMQKSICPAILCCVLPSEIMLCLCIFCLSPPGSGPIDGNTMEWICLRESLRLAALPRGTRGRRGILAGREPTIMLGWHTKEWVIWSLFCPDWGGGGGVRVRSLLLDLVSDKYMY